MKRWSTALILGVAGWTQLSLFGQSSKDTPGGQTAMLKQVGFEQRLDTQLPLHLAFRDESGQTVALSNYFKDKPVVLVPVYYECPMLCNLTMSGVVKALKVLPINPGKDFHVIMFSIDPKETPALAAEKKKAYLRRYERPGTESGWTFLTGDDPQVQALTTAIGFRYAFDPTIQQFAHAAGFVIATPQGKLSRYMFGMDPSPRDLRMALKESSQGRIGDPVAQMLLMCFHYDPTSGKYTMGVITAIRAAGVLTVALIGGFLFLSFRREKRQSV